MSLAGAVHRKRAGKFIAPGREFNKTCGAWSPQRDARGHVEVPWLWSLHRHSFNISASALHMLGPAYAYSRVAMIGDIRASSCRYRQIHVIGGVTLRSRAPPQWCCLELLIDRSSACKACVMREDCIPVARVAMGQLLAFGLSCTPWPARLNSMLLNRISRSS